jgi:hypothetical protein
MLLQADINAALFNLMVVVEAKLVGVLDLERNEGHFILHRCTADELMTARYHTDPIHLLRALGAVAIDTGVHAAEMDRLLRWWQALATPQLVPHFRNSA